MLQTHLRLLQYREHYVLLTVDLFSKTDKVPDEEMKG